MPFLHLHDNQLHEYFYEKLTVNKVVFKRLVFHRNGHLTSNGASPAAIFKWYLPSDHKLCLFTCCLSNATKMTQPFRANCVPSTLHVSSLLLQSAVCPPTIQYQDIDYWKFLSIQTVAHGNIFIRPNYAKRIFYDHKLALTILFTAVSLLQQLASRLDENTQTITLIVHIKCKYCKIQPLPVTVIIGRFEYLHLISRTDLMIAQNVSKAARVTQ